MKKIISATLALTLVLGSLVGCKNNVETIEETPVHTSSTNAPEVTTAPCTEHIFGDWAIDVESNCGIEGRRSRVCSTCGFKQEEPIEVVGEHEYEGIICTVCQMERVTFNAIGLSNFVIVAADDGYSPAAAEKLKKQLKSRFKYDIEIRSEADPESEYEIIIGDVDREILSEVDFEATSENYEYYSVRVFGKKVVFSSTKPETIASCVQKFLERFVFWGNEIKLTDKDLFSGGTNAIFGRTTTTDVRIMSNNIYIFEYSDARREYLLDSFAQMDADILLLQECNEMWHGEIDSRLEAMGYTAVPTSTEKIDWATANKNWTPVWYRASELTLLDYGYNIYTPNNTDRHSYSYTWGLFEQKSTGERFAALSTHFSWDYKELRAREATRLVEFIKEFKAEYPDIPIVAMGDFNAPKGEEAIETMMGEMEYVRHSDGLKYKNNISMGTTHKLGENTAYETTIYVIDQAFVSGGEYALNQYQHIINNLSLYSTDHIPLLLDINFTK